MEAYEHVTGERLSIVECSEGPDFFCERCNGALVGVELTKVMRDPESAQADRILLHRNDMDSGHAVILIGELAHYKGIKRAQNSRLSGGDVILVIQLVDCQLREVEPSLTSDLQEDFASTGFTEVWVAGYSDLDVFHDMALFGLHPPEWWGYHERQNPDQKPYG